MAVTQTPRLGIKKYSSGADPHPTRQEFNAHQDQLEALVALAAQGTLAERPTASKWGRLYLATDNARIYWDTGAAWVEVSNVGGGGAGEGLAIGGAGAEGSSNRAARADHTHPLPLATASAPGAMTAADKALLDGATAAATASRLVRRDSAGRVQVAAPSSGSDAATKAYVDAGVEGAASAAHTHPWSQITDTPAAYPPSTHTHPWAQVTGKPSEYPPEAHNHAASQITSGTLSPDRLPAASGSAPGAMSSAHHGLLTGATSAATGGRLAVRDTSGRIQVATPSSAADATPRAYVDAQVDTRAPSSHTHPWTQVTGKPGSFPAAPHTHPWSEVTDAPSTFPPAAHTHGMAEIRDRSSNPDGSTLVSRTPSGDFNVNTPTGSSHPASKSYVDGLISSHTHTSMINGPWELVQSSGFTGMRWGSEWRWAVNNFGELYVGNVPADRITSGVLDYSRVRGTVGPHTYAVSGSVPGTSYAVWVDGAGRLGRNTSSIRYKGDVEDAHVDPEAVLNLRPRTYLRRTEADGELITDGPRELGLIAEEVKQHLPDLVIHDSDGKVDGLRYDLLGVALLPVVQDLAERVRVLEAGR